MFFDISIFYTVPFCVSRGGGGSFYLEPYDNIKKSNPPGKSMVILHINA